MKRTREFLVGGFTLVALVILATVTIYLRNWDIFHRRANYYVLFTEVARLQKGAPVLVSGIQVGQVTWLAYRMNETQRVRVTIQIDKDIRLYSNARVEVNAAPVLGDTTINIEAGQPGKGITPIPPDTTLMGVQSSDITQMVGEVSADLRNTLQGASAIVNDPQNQAAIKQAIGNLASASERFNATLTMVNTEFQPVMDQLKTTVVHLNAFMEDAKGITTRLDNDVATASHSISTTADDVSGSAKNVGSAANDIAKDFNTSSAQLHQTLDLLNATLKENQQSLHETLTQLSGASQALNQIVDRTNKGQGTLGRMINDPRPFDDLRQLITALSQALTGRAPLVFPIQDAPGVTPTPSMPGTRTP